MIPADQRRRLRCGAALVLAAFLAAFVLRSDEGGWRTILAGLGVLVALAVVLRLPRRTHGLHRAGLALLLSGLGLLLAGHATARLGEERAGIARLCEGQSAVVAGWNLRLNRVLPVTGDGYTAFAAQIEASRAGGAPIKLAPQMRFAFAKGAEADGTAKSALPAGDLALGFTGFEPAGACMAIDVGWRPLAGVARGGGWLGVLGALLIALAAALGLNWRLSARERIAMRREDRPLARVRPVRPAWPVWAGLAALLACAAWLAGAGTGPGAVPAAAPYPGGAALVAARQTASSGPANTNRWVVIADAMMRHGQYANAAEVLLGAVERNPHDIEAWRALGDALHAYAGGEESLPARYARARGGLR